MASHPPPLHDEVAPSHEPDVAERVARYGREAGDRARPDQAEGACEVAARHARSGERPCSTRVVDYYRPERVNHECFDVPFESCEGD